MFWRNIFRVHSKIDGVIGSRISHRGMLTGSLELQFKYFFKGDEFISIPSRFLTHIKALQINGKFDPRLLKQCKLKLEIDKMRNFEGTKKRLLAQLAPKKK